MQLDPDQFADTVLAAIATATAPLLARIASLEQRISSVKNGQDGVPGRDGASVDPAIFLDLQARCVAAEARAAALPTAADMLAAVGSMVTAEISKQPPPDVAPVIAAEVQRAVATLPTPKDGAPGEPGAPVDPLFVSALIKSAVADAVAALPAPNDGERGERGEAGAPGVSVDPSSVDVMVRAAVADAVERIPTPRDGQSPTADDIRPLVAEEVQKAVAALPVPKDWERGEAGAAGPSVDPADVDAMVSAHVSKAIAALPPPQSGERGERGERGESAAPVDPGDIEAMVTKAVAALPEPKDGVGVVGTIVDRDGHLVVTLSDGSVKHVGQVVGRDVDMTEVHRLIASEVAKIPHPKDGEPGAPGRDGSLENLKIEPVDDRHVKFCFKDGTPIEGGLVSRGAVVYRGVYRAGDTYELGDLATWGGSMWHANKETTAKPGDGSSDWTLSVKKGSDGKEGKAITGPPGPRGEPGPIGPARY